MKVIREDDNGKTRVTEVALPSKQPVASFGIQAKRLVDLPVTMQQQMAKKGQLSETDKAWVGQNGDLKK